MNDLLPHVSTLPVLRTELIDTFIPNLAAQVIIVDASELINHIFSIRTFREGCVIFEAWCQQHNVAYYARPRESFSYEEAIAEAINNQKPYLIVEDLS